MRLILLKEYSSHCSVDANGVHLDRGSSLCLL